MEGPPLVAVSVPRPVEPKFHFLEINTANLSGLGPHITIDPKVTVFKVREGGLGVSRTIL
jgi:hypothetical protein